MFRIQTAVVCTEQSKLIHFRFNSYLGTQSLATVAVGHEMSTYPYQKHGKSRQLWGILHAVILQGEQWLPPKASKS